MDDAKRYGMKVFNIELRGLYPRDEWTYAKVYYESEQIYLIVDEFGKDHYMRDLSLFDKNRIEQALILNLQADEMSIMDIADRIKLLAEEIKRDNR